MRSSVFWDITPVPHHGDVLAIGGIAPTFLTLTLDGGDRSASRPDRLIPGEIFPGTLCIGGWVEPRTSLDAVEKKIFLAPTENRPLAVQPVGRHYTD
jgi:hypothetical protein